MPVALDCECVCKIAKRAGEWVTLTSFFSTVFANGVSTEKNARLIAAFLVRQVAEGTEGNITFDKLLKLLHAQLNMVTLDLLSLLFILIHQGVYLYGVVSFSLVGAQKWLDFGRLALGWYRKQWGRTFGAMLSIIHALNELPNFFFFVQWLENLIIIVAAALLIALLQRWFLLKNSFLLQIRRVLRVLA